MLTAEAQDQDRLTGEETGADFYMTKPFSADKLLAKIAEFLGEWKATAFALRLRRAKEVRGRKSEIRSQRSEKRF